MSMAHQKASTSIHRAQVVHAPPQTKTVWHGDYIEVTVLDVPDNKYAIEPKFDTSPNHSSNNELWPNPGLVNSIAGRIRIPNLTKELKVVKQNSHF